MLSGIEASYLLAILVAIYARAIGTERTADLRQYFVQYRRCAKVKYPRKLARVA